MPTSGLKPSTRHVTNNWQIRLVMRSKIGSAYPPGMATQISRSDFEALGLTNWTWSDGAIEAAFPASPFAGGGALVAAIAAAADEANHHPDLTLSYPGTVGVRLTTHSEGGVTDLDVELARTIDGLASDRGIG